MASKTPTEVQTPSLAISEQIAAAKATLQAKWAQTINQNDGSFEFLFGDPSATPFASLIRVYFDEETGDTCVDIEFPLETSAFSDEEWFTEPEKKELEGIVLESSHLLDTDVPLFGSTIYGFLRTFDDHPSLNDDEMDRYEALKAEGKMQQQEEKKQKKAEQEKLDEENRTRKLLKPVNKIPEAHLQILRRQELWREYMKAQELEMKKQAVLAKKTPLGPGDALRRAREIHYERLARSEPLLHLEPAAELQAGYPGIMDLVLRLDSKYNNESSVREFTQEEHFLWNYMEVVLLTGQHFFGHQKRELVRVPTWLSILRHVQEVNLSENKLTIIPGEIVELPNLKRLFLHTNSLKVFPAIPYNSPLEHLDIHNNQLIALPEGLEHCDRLRALDAEKNRLLDFSSICGLKKLYHINVAHNRIKIVPGELYLMEGTLEYLNLKHNPIANLPPHVYLKGMRPTLAFLKEHLSLGESTSAFQPHTIRHDIHTYWSSNSGLCDLTVGLTNQDDPSFVFYSVPVHSYLLKVRLPSISPLITTAMAKPRTGDEALPSVLLPISKDALTLLLRYAYSDQYDAPAVPTMPDIGQSLAHLTIDDRNLEITKAQSLHAVMVTAWRKQLDGELQLAKTYNLPYLQFMVQKALGTAPRIPPSSTYIEDLRSLLSSDASHDVSFRCASEPDLPLLSGHKSILSARSAYLTSLLTGGLMESSQRVVVLEDISHSTLKAIIEYCYTDDVAELDPEWIMELLMKSRLFGIELLLSFVQSVIGYSLDTQNVCGILTTAYMYSLVRLAKATKFFVLTHWAAVTKDPSWADVSHEIRVRLRGTAVKWGILDQN